MLLFKENARERERGREESRFVGFLFEIGSKTCVRITRLLSRSVQIVEEEEEEEDEKKEKEVTFFLLLLSGMHNAPCSNTKQKKPKIVVEQV